MGYVVLLVALSLSAVAAWYSVAGLMVLFAAASMPVAIMASTLEVAKLVTASWLYNNWKRVPLALKGYLTFAVMVLMFVTSIGIFGFLSKAHLDQAMPVGDIATKLEIIDQKIAAQQDLVTSARTVLKQLDEAVNQSLGRGAGTLPPNATPAQIQAAQTAAERNTNQAATLRRNQQKERDTQQANINKAQAEIQKMRDERAPIAAQQRTLEAEVGPIKYVAELIWGGDAKSHFDSAVRFLIITLIFVFDPLAVLLVIAANMTFAWYREDKAAKAAKAAEEAAALAVNDQITDAVTAKPDVVNPQITDAVTQIHPEIDSTQQAESVQVASPVTSGSALGDDPIGSIKEISQASRKAAASSEPRPFFPRQEAGVVGQMPAEPNITEIESHVDLDMSRKTKVDNLPKESIIEPLVQLPEEEIRQVLMTADDSTLEEVYARIVQETRLDEPNKPTEPDDALHDHSFHKPNSTGTPPGTVLPHAVRRRNK